MQAITADELCKYIAIDLVTDLPSNVHNLSSLLVITDLMSTFVVLEPLCSKKKETVTRALKEVIALFGPPKRI